jgi:hypothetical protein
MFGLALFGGLVALLLWATGRPALPALDTDLGSAVAALAADAAWVCLVWIAIAVAVSVIAQAPGRLGRAAGVVADHVAPVVIRRAVHAVFGLSLAAAPVLAPAAAASTAQPVAVTAGTPAMSLTSLPSLDRPGTFDIDPPVVAEPAAPDPAPDPEPDSTSEPMPDPSPGATYVVKRGDTLWAIAARHLPSPASAGEIANAWPQWYKANRDVIGDDPNLIFPGQVLQAPALSDVTR